MAIKKAFTAIHTALSTNPTATAQELLDTPSFMALMEASKGGFSGEDPFVTVDNQKVARICSATKAVFTIDNSDKDRSFFYKGGSQIIPAEVLKANAHKAHNIAQDAKAQELEDKMLDGAITPQEWKEQNQALNEEKFTHELTAEQIADLIETFGGYETKEAYIADEDPELFSSYTDEIEAIRAEAPEKQD